ncbi:glycosyl transferase family 1 [Capsulimonas corticalis]|uniref:Glycosyl transferase family 1 n=1 Tax=Capsulimonas corticalis TaxID=2219043 RepID=A0A402CRJ7_9BACT|nr:glycosyltransferase family 4 protein [Capsulimonas corticalis]BDI28135.1 glycosyl transferase family 1 [Capsulimonas corticalis]
MRIGFVMSTEVGLKTQYQNWRDGLTPDLGIDPEWITIDWWKQGGTLERLPGIPKKVKATLRSILELREGITHGPFDALFVANETVFRGQSHLLRKQPYFMTVDSTRRQLLDFGALYGKKDSRFPMLNRYTHNVQVSRLREAQALFPWSRWAGASINSDYGVESHRIHVIPPGINLSKWRMPERKRRPGPTNLLFVGGDYYRKGGDLLMDWAERHHDGDFVLHMVTRERATPCSDKVRMYHHLSANDPELISLYRQADAFVLPTRGDCYSIASMEAMASGLPVIVSRTGGTEDIIREGETGYLIDPGNAAQLAERLDTILADPEQRLAMGSKARRDAEERFDVNKNIRRTLEVMRSYLQ